MAGFGDESVQKVAKDDLISFCSERFGDEFINKVDEFVAFSDLDDESLVRIADMMLRSMASRLSINGVELKWSASVPKRIVEMREPGEGVNAKPIERVIKKVVESLVSDKVMEGQRSECRITLKAPVKGGITAIRARTKSR